MIIKQKVSDPGGNAAYQIKQQIPERPHLIFHIIAENVQKPHVAEEMPESAVQEHEREKRKKLLAGRKIGCDMRVGVSDRYQPVYVDKTIQVGPLSQLDEENKDIDADKTGSTFEYWHRRVEKDKVYAYVLVAVNVDGREGDPAYVTVQ